MNSLFFHTYSSNKYDFNYTLAELTKQIISYKKNLEE